MGCKWGGEGQSDRGTTGLHKHMPTTKVWTWRRRVLQGLEKPQTAKCEVSLAEHRETQHNKPVCVLSRPRPLSDAF